MKIGIYGDSFAAHNGLGVDHQWPIILGKNITGSNITNYAKSSTSVYYSYKQFLNNYHKHDINIFLVTNPYRYTKPIIETHSNKEIFFGTLNGVEDYKKRNIKNLSSIDIKVLNDLIGWFLSSDGEFLSTASELMINQLLTLDSKVILFPCFEESFTDSQYKKYGISKEHVMHNYVKRIITLLNITPEFNTWTTEVPSTMAQHLTPEFNEFVADCMYKKIITGIWDFSNFKNIKLEHPREYYYK
jgi:hypothetical protein